MVSNLAYYSTETEGFDNDSEIISPRKATSERNEKAYSYGEAIDLAGNGSYNVGLLATLSLALLAMALDMFSFAVVVTLSSCEFQLNQTQKSILVSMPFTGPIIMAYAWGYISDVYGRRNTLLVGMCVSFLVSILSAFSPHWSMLAVCRFVSTCFCSCAQSASYTLLGESCPERVKGSYMLIMTSVIHLNLCIYYALAYFISGVHGFDGLGFITFGPWRLLVIILALPLGICAISLYFFYESPKFLLNAGREDEALELLRQIYRRNGGDMDKYSVKKLELNEFGNIKRESKPLLSSLREQTYPLFKPPFLQKTMLLYFLIFVIYSTSSSQLVWLPFLATSFSEGVFSEVHDDIVDQSEGLCSMITVSQNSTTTETSSSCTFSIDLPVVVGAILAGSIYSILNAAISKLASRKRVVLMVVFLIAGCSGIGTMVIPNNIASVVLYFGILLNCLNMGISFSYCVDFYPTSFRGMAACLGVMVARISSLIGVNLVGPFVRSHCSITFYALSFLNICGAILSYFLPPDRPKKV